MDKELEKFCKNCKKYVDSANFVSHRAFCQRNITICKVCDEPIPKYSKKEHEKEYHISVICDMCNTSVKKWRLEKHQEEICPKRLVICEFCEVKFPIDGIQEHNEFCGSRTEKCKICLKYIMLRNKKKHLEVHMHGENFHRGNGAGEVHQSTVNKITSKTSGKVEKKKLEEKKHRDMQNDQLLDLIEKQRLYFKTVKDFKEVHMHELKFHELNDEVEKLNKLLNSLPGGIGGFGKEEICPKRFCEFCLEDFPIDKAQEHNEFCGSRPQKCSICSKYIMSRYKKDHLERHMRETNDEVERLRNARLYSNKLLNSRLPEDIGGFGKNSTETCMNYGEKLPVHELSSHKQVGSKILKKQCEYCDKELHCDDSEENHLKNCAVYNHSISEIHLLSNHFKDLFTNENCWDTVLQVGSKEFKVHRAILIARSSVFFAMFQHDTSEKQTGIVKIPDCDPDSFQQFLEYLYCGKLKHFSSDLALPLYIISDKYNVQELKTFCTKYLMKNITVQSMCEVAILADKFDEAELFSATEDFFNENFKEIVMTSEWENLMKKNFRLANKLLIGKAKAE